jgi:hypothetical protein
VPGWWSKRHAAAKDAMTSRWNLHAAWPRVATLCFRGGALALLLHVTSLYTRDWRPLVSSASQAAETQGALRATAASEPQPFAVKPVATGAAARSTDRVRHPAAETVARPSSASSGAGARPAARRAAAHRGQNKRTQVAGAPAAKDTTRDVLPASGPEAPVQFVLAERGN